MLLTNKVPVLSTRNCLGLIFVLTRASPCGIGQYSDMSGAVCLLAARDSVLLSAQVILPARHKKTRHAHKAQRQEKG